MQRFLKFLLILFASTSASAQIDHYIHCEKSAPHVGFDAITHGEPTKLYTLSVGAYAQDDDDYKCGIYKGYLKEEYQYHQWSAIYQSCSAVDNMDEKKFVLSSLNWDSTESFEMEIIDGERYVHFSQVGTWRNHDDVEHATFGPGECKFTDTPIKPLTTEPRTLLTKKIRSAGRVDSTKIVWNKRSQSWQIGFYGQAEMDDFLSCSASTENCLLGQYQSIGSDFNFWSFDVDERFEQIYVGELNPRVDLDGDGILEQLTVTTERQTVDHGLHDDVFLWVKVTAHKIQ